MPSVLVTGAGGFLGSRIAATLHGAGVNVRGLVHRAHKEAPTAYPVHIGDVTEEETLVSSARGVDVVIHCAGLAHRPNASEKEYERVNVLGTRNLTQQAVHSGVKQFILMSSTAVYGNQNGPWRESDIARPDTPYGRSRLRAEETCLDLARGSKMRVVILRLSALYGEGDPGNILRLLSFVYRYGPIVVGNGENKKSLTYVGNVAQLCARIVTQYPEMATICNVSDPSAYSLSEIVQHMEDSIGKGRKVRHVSRSLMLLGSQALSVGFSALGRPSPISPERIKVMTSTSVCDVTRLREQFRFVSPVLLPEGLKAVTQWYEQARVRGKEG